MAPEVVQVEPVYGKEVDVWSMGCILFEMMHYVSLLDEELCHDESLVAIPGWPSQKKLIANIRKGKSE